MSNKPTLLERRRARNLYMPLPKSATSSRSPLRKRASRSPPRSPSLSSIPENHAVNDELPRNSVVEEILDQMLMDYHHRQATTGSPPDIHLYLNL